MLMFAFHGQEYNEQLKFLIEELKIGGVVHFGRNIDNVSQVINLNEDIIKNSSIKPFIALDQEGGAVLRVMHGITSLPGAMALASGDIDKIEEICYYVGLELAALGFNINLAPVGDVNNNPYNPVINSRSYSDDPAIVANLAMKAFKGFNKANLITTMKHFLGHGDTNVDSHIGLPCVNKSKKELEELELVPFRNAIENGINGIMTSHILYPAYDEKFPATLSKNIITELLKNELGFKGLIMTDSLTMGAIWTNFSLEEILVNSVCAGVDILTFCGKASMDEQKLIFDTFVHLVENNKIPITRIEESYNKIIRYKQSLPHINKLYPFMLKQDLAKLLQEKSICLIKDKNRLIPICENDTLILFPKIKIVTLVDDLNKQISLKDYLDCEEIIYDVDTNIDNIVDCVKSYSKVVLCTYNVKLDDYQNRLYRSLDKGKTIVVALRSPYDYLYLKPSSYILLFEATKLSLQTLAKALRGKIKITGKVKIKMEEYG